MAPWLHPGSKSKQKRRVCEEIQAENQGRVLEITSNLKSAIRFKTNFRSDVYISSKIAAAQVYHGSADRKLWLPIDVKNQPCAIETGDLHDVT